MTKELLIETFKKFAASDKVHNEIGGYGPGGIAHRLVLYHKGTYITSIQLTHSYTPDYISGFGVGYDLTPEEGAELIGIFKARTKKGFSFEEVMELL